MKKNIVIIGGNSGIGLSLMERIIDTIDCKIFCYGKGDYHSSVDCINYQEINLANKNIEFAKSFVESIDVLIITAGFGRVALFEELEDAEIENLIKVNYSSIAEILKAFYPRIKSKKPFYSMVLGSIAGHISSPLFSVYGSAKAGLCSLIENLNIELRAEGYENRILDVSPGSLKGTSFNGGKTDTNCLRDLANEMLNAMFSRKELFIPDYEKTYKSIIKRYQSDPIGFGIESYKYKMASGRKSNKPQLVIGYLSGTFDLFHIGHLNLLRKAKEQCDYLIVGVHKSGAWKGKETFIPFEERLEIVKNIKYVDKAIESFTEDSEAWEKYRYHKLFVGSDYKGTERFKKYEQFFKDKNVKIVYFPYTKGTSSTQLREKIMRSK